MKKVMKIEGMMCGHCVAHVTKVLNALDGVSATVSLENKEAVLEIENNITDEELVDIITKEGYSVDSIK